MRGMVRFILYKHLVFPVSVIDSSNFLYFWRRIYWRRKISRLNLKVYLLIKFYKKSLKFDEKSIFLVFLIL